MGDQSAVLNGFDLTVEKLYGWGDAFYLLLPNLIVGSLLFLIILLVGFTVRRSLRLYFSRKDRVDLGRLVSVFAFWTFTSVGFLIFLTVVIPSLKPVDLLASVGFGSLAFGFAFKDILQNWLAGLLILMRQPFRRGDQIQVNDAEGTVIAIEPRATIIRTYAGSDIIIPNSTIYTANVIVHTSQPTRRVEIELTIGYAYDIRQITQLIENALAPIEEIIKDPAPQVLCWDLGATSLGIRIRWWIDSGRSNEISSRSRAIHAIKDAFDAHKIDPTDPQLIYYQRSTPPDFPDPEMVSIKATPTPPATKISANDPEKETVKRDSKTETLLPDT